jgi:hypothetical protein
LRLVEGGQVVGVGVGQGFEGGAGGFGLVLSAEGFEALLQDAAQRLLHQVAGDEGGGIDGAFLLAAAAGLGRFCFGSFGQQRGVAAGVSRRILSAVKFAPTAGRVAQAVFSES